MEPCFPPAPALSEIPDGSMYSDRNEMEAIIMTLSEKILYYRKSAGLSQEELAARVGVSRQAVSKWETGESTPELSKVVLLARAFQITTDQLLSPEAPQSSRPSSAPSSSPSRAPDPKYQAIPFLGRMVRRWGWLAGVYLFLQGAGMTLVGGIARYAFSAMMSPVSQSMGLSGTNSGLVEALFADDPFSRTASVFLTIPTVIMVLGILVMIAGAVLTLLLWRERKKNP